MQILPPHKAFCRTPRVDMTESGVADARLAALGRIDELVAQGVTAAAAAKGQGICRATCYNWRKAFREGGLRGLAPKSSRPRSHPGRQWTPLDGAHVLRLREEFPFEGKARIAIRHNRLHPDRPLSESTVGRILADGIKRGRIERCDFAQRAKPKQARDFSRGHAARYGRGNRHEGVQCDHMTVNIAGKACKQFTAVHPITREMVSRVYSVATSRVAREFLRLVLDKFGRGAIQVDGGSEFRGEFEEACREEGVKLIVLPPRSPELNGMAGRVNRTLRHECWDWYLGEVTCAAMNERVREFVRYYNDERPHRSLGMKTPAEAGKIMRTMSGSRV